MINLIENNGVEISGNPLRRRLAMASAVVAGLCSVAAYGQTMSPITISGFTQDVIAETSPAASTTTAGFDAYNNYAYLVGGYPGASATGLPASGSFVSASNPSTTFQFAPYTGNNALLFNTATNASHAPQVSSGAVTITTPSPYSNIALLNAAANGSVPISYTIKFANGDTQTGSFTGLDWFNNNPYAITGLGRVDRNGNPPENNGNNPQMYENDIAIQAADQTQNLTEIDFSASGSGSQWGLFAVSGYASPQGFVWAGLVNNTWDNSTANWAGNKVFPATNANATFDDSAPSTATAITVASGGVTPFAVAFNNSTNSYSFTGGPVTSVGTLTMNGTGSVTLGNSNTFGGAVILNAGTLVVSGTGTLDGGVLATSSPSATLNISSGGVVGSHSTMALTGPGTIYLAGSLTVGGNTQYVGNISGPGSLTVTGGTVIVSTGSFNLPAGVIVGTTATSTAALVITDGTGNAGTVGGVPFNLTLAGTGPAGTTTGVTANTGALAGGDGNTFSYAGNVIIAPVGGSISGGNGGTLIVNGKISGSGPVTFSTNDNSVTVLNSSNTYTGETRIKGTSNAFETSTLQIGVDNAIPAASGVNFINSSSLNSLDLNGHNQTVAYLSGGGGTSSVGNVGTTLSTLTINNGNNATGPATFTGVIRDGGPLAGNGPVALVKSGSGNQVLTSTNTYSGGTNISAGTLTAVNSKALGAGPVLLSGGTLSLGTKGIASGLHDFSGFQLNGSATTTGSTLQLTNGTPHTAGSAFASSPVGFDASHGFTLTFLYAASGEPSVGSSADGVTFTVQNDPRGTSALGGDGGALGYGGTGAIVQSAALQFNIYGSSLGFGTNGTISDSDTTPGYPGFNQATTVTYNPVAQTITSTYTDGFNGTYTNTYSGVNLVSLLGGNAGYIGFTGASGDATATQTISNFNFSGGVPGAPADLNNFVSTAPSTSSVLTAKVSPGYTGSTILGLNISTGSTLLVTSTTDTPGTHLVLTTGALNFAGGAGHWTGVLDLTNSNLVVQNGVLATVTDQVKQGYAGGTWQGSGGITSGAAAADSNHLTALGVIVNNIGGSQLYGTAGTLGLFDGANPGANDVLVKYTYYGDTDLNGVVDGSDYSRVDAAYLADKVTANAATGWFNGDFNYDGTVNGSDYTLLDNAFNSQGASLAAQVATATAQVGGSAVPEPATLSLLGLAGVGMLSRRRRR